MKRMERMVQKFIFNADMRGLKNMFSGLLAEVSMPLSQDFLEEDVENLKFFMESVKKWRPEDIEALKEEAERFKGILERFQTQWF